MREPASCWEGCCAPLVKLSEVLAGVGGVGVAAVPVESVRRVGVLLRFALVGPRGQTEVGEPLEEDRAMARLK